MNQHDLALALAKDIYIALDKHPVSPRHQTIHDSLCNEAHRLACGLAASAPKKGGHREYALRSCLSHCGSVLASLDLPPHDNLPEVRAKAALLKARVSILLETFVEEAVVKAPRVAPNLTAKARSGPQNKIDKKKRHTIHFIDLN